MADHAHKLLALYYTAKKIDVSLRYRRALIASSLPNLGLDKARPHLDGSLPHCVHKGDGANSTRNCATETHSYAS
jgi:hypothetical protein